jgi:Tfp pilus assembly protein PilP
MQKAVKYNSLLVFLLAMCIGIFACEEDPNSDYRPPQRSAPIGTPSPEARAELKKGSAGAVLKENEEKANASIRAPKIAETDFIESIKRRDPFRPFIEVIVPKPEVRENVEREIKLEEYDIEQLRLIAIITNVGDPRAMVVPPNNEGFILRRGDYVGKPDFIDPGNGADRIQINWKVARIHGSGKKEERGVYLVRDDPLTPTPDDVKRFMPLYPQD